MQVILLERIGKLGQMGDVVTVKDGFARNFLLPQGKALRATKPNMERFENERSQLEARNLEQKKDADNVAVKVDGESFTIIRQAGETGQLYGSVSTRDIAANIAEAGLQLERRQVMLDRPIKILGLHPVRLALHPEVEVTVTVNVARSEDEAVRQARGEDVTASDDDEDLDEDAIAPEDVFEDKELAEEAAQALQEDATEDETAVSADAAEGPEREQAVESQGDAGDDKKED
ncbi:MAG: 50S ribosomal protein L9 [Hyphomicrobiales bacterium]|nr:50S ribosomal protein L9 [Hyphomicrobiales bacterium]